MKVLIEKCVKSLRLAPKDKNDHDSNGEDFYSWEFELMIETRLVPSGENLITEKKFCDEINRSITSLNGGGLICLKLRLEKDLNNYHAWIELAPYAKSGVYNDKVSILEQVYIERPCTALAITMQVSHALSQPPIVIFDIKSFLKSDGTWKHSFGLTETKAKFLRHAFKTGVFNQSITLTIEAPTSVNNHGIRYQTNVYKRMLEEEIGSDLVIVLENKTEIKCHKGVLMTQSDVFRAMFENDMKEAQTGKLHLNDMSEDVVKAFLQYLYYGGLAEAEKNCQVAVQLLYAADQYHLPDMEQQIVKMMVDFMNDAFSVEVALNIFLLLNDRDYFDAKALKAKLVKILKSKISELKDCPCFNNLCRTNLIDLLVGFAD